MFVRFTATSLNDSSDRPVGIFHAVRYLRDDGLLTREQEESANTVFDWLSDNLDAPPEEVLEANPEAVSWFRITATDHIAYAQRLIPILELHGYHVMRAQLLDPGLLCTATLSRCLLRRFWGKAADQAHAAALLQNLGVGAAPHLYPAPVLTAVDSAHALARPNSSSE
jgi:hypothetical protein